MNRPFPAYQSVVCIVIHRVQSNELAPDIVPRRSAVVTDGIGLHPDISLHHHPVSHGQLELAVSSGDGKIVIACHLRGITSVKVPSGIVLLVHRFAVNTGHPSTEGDTELLGHRCPVPIVTIEKLVLPPLSKGVEIVGISCPEFIVPPIAVVAVGQVRLRVGRYGG